MKRHDESDSGIILAIVILFILFFVALSGCSCKAGSDFISELACTQEDK